ncbi:hypothetical protein K7X08_026594 [Anisodus acutangulus]|uniref:aminocyclopropanecarboxylate oxidase n=1 Tax=Anisodus acutangulus TaxID=402998 RepID=A0A9Q1QW28_9SOLA|nr:hypothetical protein K7X08_026594 [Anisodus acutangulus]
MAIPVIDFSKLNGEERAKTLAQIATCCEEWGFFQSFKKEREENFNKSTAVKLLNEVEKNNKCNNGKVENVEWEDVFLLTDDNGWPFHVPQFRKTMKEYRIELKNLAERVMEVMDENLGLPKGYIKKAFNNGKNGSENPFFGTKVSHYPPCPNPEMVNGLRAHTDAGGVILLFQDDQVDGLQILKDGEWIDVQPIQNAIVINTGDQIEVLSNGKYKSVWHRVLAKENGNRRSIASFYNPSYKATIAPAPQLIGEINKDNKEDQVKLISNYPSFVFGDYMNVYTEQKFLPKEPRFQAVRAM